MAWFLNGLLKFTSDHDSEGITSHCLILLVKHHEFKRFTLKLTVEMCVSTTQTISIPIVNSSTYIAVIIDEHVEVLSGSGLTEHLWQAEICWTRPNGIWIDMETSNCSIDFVECWLLLSELKANNSTKTFRRKLALFLITINTECFVKCKAVSVRKLPSNHVKWEFLFRWKADTKSILCSVFFVL